MQKNSGKQRLHTIALMRSGAVGDCVLTLPAIESLRRAMPDHPLRLMGPAALRQLAAAEAMVDIDHPLLAQLHREAPPGAACAELFADVRLLIAYSAPGGTYERHLRQLVPGQVALWDPRPPASGHTHVVEHLLAPLRRLGIVPLCTRPRIALTAGDLAYADQHVHTRPIIAHPGSGGGAKCWPLERYVEWGRRLLRAGFEVLFVWGPVERERGLQVPAEIPHLEPPDLRALAALLARARLFVGNDSGPGHVAAAVGAPTLSLFGPTDPRLWAPRGPASRVLRAPAGDLARLPVETVLDATRAML